VQVVIRPAPSCLILCACGGKNVSGWRCASHVRMLSLHHPGTSSQIGAGSIWWLMRFPGSQTVWSSPGTLPSLNPNYVWLPVRFPWLQPFRALSDTCKPKKGRSWRG
jgi:hypothetical protein